MKKKQGITKKIADFFQLLYIKLFKINDTPHKIALGMGIGVFAGIFPGTGPIAALCLALVLRANRASALLGALLTNTWISFLVFVLSIQVGSVILRLDWQDVYQQSFLNTILPVLLGYIIVGLGLSLIAYAGTYLILRRLRHESKS